MEKQRDVMAEIKAVRERNRKDYEALAVLTGKSIAEVEADTTEPDLGSESRFIVEDDNNGFCPVCRHESINVGEIVCDRCFDQAQAFRIFGPMLPNYERLSQHEPQSQIEDSRGAADLPGGGALNVSSIPTTVFTPTITSMVDADHDVAGCTVENCNICTILETRRLFGRR